MRRLTWIAAIAVASLTSTVAVAETAEEKAMAHKIARQLKESGELKDYRVGVKYEDGVAWLLGTVRTEQQLSAAIRVAERVRGVDHVVSKMEVTSDDGNSMADSLKLASLQAQRQLARGSTQGARTPRNRAMGNSRLNLRGAPNRRGMPLPARRVASRPQPAPMPASPIRPISAQNAGPAPANFNQCGPGGAVGGMMPAYVPGGGGARGVSYDQAAMPAYAWPTYASYPNYAGVTYPRQYSPTAWPYIGPFYPYPQVPLGWRKVCLEWDDGWWFLDFSDCATH